VLVCEEITIKNNNNSDDNCDNSDNNDQLSYTPTFHKRSNRYI